MGEPVKASSNGKGLGAEFIIEIRTGSSHILEAIPTPGSPANNSCRKVLLIEDNIDTAETMRMLLELEGHRVSVAGSGPKGIEVAEKERPDVIFCGIGLPGTMNGYDVAQEIRRRKTLPDVYLIALTGYGQPDDIRKAESAGFDLHLTKPVDTSALQRAIAKISLAIEKPTEGIALRQS